MDADIKSAATGFVSSLADRLRRAKKEVRQKNKGRETDNPLI